MPRPGRSQRLLRHALATVTGGPWRAAGLAAWIVLCSSLAAVAILAAVRREGPLPVAHELAGRVVLGLLIAAAALLAIRWWLRREGADGDDGASHTPADRDGWTAVILAGAALTTAMLAPLYFLARSTEASTRVAVLYPYLDRRWMVATFLVGTAGVMLLTALAARLVHVARGSPPTWRRWLLQTAGAGGTGPEAPAHAAPRARTGLKLLAACLIALYFFGPPWNIGANLQPVDSHETFQLGALQAVDDGTTPYVGEAASQYGPGTQMASYLHMQGIGGNSVVGFRESYALFNWLAATLFFSMAVLRLRFFLALTTIAIAILVFPTLQEFEFERAGLDRAGTLVGFYGWFNALRYVGAIALVLFLPWAARQGSRGLAAGFGLGLLWGLSCYFAQENLGAGAIGMLVLGALLVLSGTVRAGALVRAWAGIAIGAGVVALAVVAAYAFQGEAEEFIRNYLLVPSAVTAGYSNSPFREGIASDWGPMFYFLPFGLAALGLASLLETRPLRIATEWTRERVLLVSAVVACVATYSGSLLRADSSHLINTTLAVPLLTVTAAVFLPRLLGLRTIAARVAAGTALAAGVALLIPLGQFKKAPERLFSPLTARVAMLGADDPPEPRGVAGNRIGGALASAPSCCTSSLIDTPAPIPMSDFTEFLDDVRRAVGDRATYVTFGRGNGMPGIVYFGADLREAPLSTEPGTLLVDGDLESDFLEEFGRDSAQVQALVTNDVAPNPERDIFLSAHPNPREVTLTLAGQPVHVLLAE